MKVFFCLLTAFFLTGCASLNSDVGQAHEKEYSSFIFGVAPIAAVDKTYIKLVEEKKEVLVDVVESERISVDCARKMGLSLSNKRFLGCAIWDVKKGMPICTVILPKNFQSVILGHEMRHCFEGGFHS